MVEADVLDIGGKDEDAVGKVGSGINVAELVMVVVVKGVE